MKSTNPIYLDRIDIASPERYRHLLVWGIVWVFMVSGGIEVGWPLWFSTWTQTPYVLLFAALFYGTLFNVCPQLHKNRGQLILRHLLIGVLFMLVYTGFNRTIPEYGATLEEFPDYPISSDIIDAMTMLVFIWIPAYGVYYSKYGVALIQRNSQRVIELAEAKEQLVRRELQVYKSQFNGHLTFNTLSHIYSKIMDQEAAAKPILLLSEILRYNTSAKADSPVGLETEITHLQNFIQIHKIIYPNLNIVFSIQGDIQGCCILPRILVSFVENAIKHGAGNDPDFPITVILSVNDALNFKVVNKVRSTVRCESTHMGLDITRQTLSAYYGEQFSLEIEQNEAIFRVCLKLVMVKNPVLTSQLTYE